MQQMKDDAFIAMLDVFIQSVLLVRDVYPQDAFRKRSVFNITSYFCIHPGVNKYMKSCLETARDMKMARGLRAVELLLLHKPPVLFGCSKIEVLERYVFNVLPDDGGTTTKDNLPYLKEYQDQLRVGLAILNSNTKEMPSLGKMYSFRIQLQTNEQTFIDQCEKENAKTEEDVCMRDFLFIFQLVVNVSIMLYFVFSVFSMGRCANR